MEIQINLYKVGYVTGRCCSKLIKYAGAAQLAKFGYYKVVKIAANHKVNSSDADVVTNNVFECLKYID
jgi:hypothetical protein